MVSLGFNWCPVGWDKTLHLEPKLQSPIIWQDGKTARKDTPPEKTLSHSKSSLSSNNNSLD